jgi:hypothetical protein
MRVEPFTMTSHRQLGIEHAAWLALLLWVTLLITCLVAMAVCIIAGWPHMDQAEPAVLDGWFAASVVVFALAVPAAAMWNRAIFQKHWEDGVVTPYGYVLGSLVLWSSFTFCTIFASAACVSGGSFWPHAMLGMLGIILLLGSWPSGRNMVNPRPREEEDDDDIFHMTPQEEDQLEDERRK